MFGIKDSDENKDAFQPTPPQNFRCTNPTAYGRHPHFEWETPEEPHGVTFYYNIYRDLGAGYRKITANPLTATEYTDTGIEIIKYGANTAHYYVTAKGAASPESAASDIVDIKTNTAEKMVPAAPLPDTTDADYVTTSSIRLIGNHPNPFNHATMIRFQLVQATAVRLEIYTVLGTAIRTLVTGPMAAGIHELRWDGKNSPGEAVPSGVYLAVQTARGRQEVRKLVLAK